MYKIKLGVPEMKSLWEDLSSKIKNKTANKDEEKKYKKIGKALKLLSENPRYPGLQTHEIDSLSKRYGLKVWESYLENNTPRAGRIFWVYGPEKNDITVIGLEPHPDDKSNEYKKIILSKFGEEVG